MTRQRDLIADLIRDGEDATSVIALLRQFEDLLARLMIDRDVLRKRLAAAAR